MGDLWVCGNVSYFEDDDEVECEDCSTKVYARPHRLKHARVVCLSCASKDVKDKQNVGGKNVNKI